MMTREIQADVVVVGGGSGGLAAVLGAVAAGAGRVLLIERGACLGGMGTQALVHTFCGLYGGRDLPQAANPGVPTELVRRLQACGGAGQPKRMGKVWVLPHDPNTLVSVLDDWLRELPTAELWFHTELVAATVTDERIREVQVLCHGRQLTVRAAAFVDATGDATLTALSGAGYDMVASDRLLRPACIAELAGLNDSWLLDQGRLKLSHAVVRAVRDGRLDAAAMGFALRAGLRMGQSFLTLDMEGHHDSSKAWDPLDPGCLAAAEMTGRQLISAILGVWGGVCPELHGVEVKQWPSRLGVRESRRACGVYQLTREDVLSERRFADGVARAVWPMEFREDARGPRLVYAAGMDGTDIPLRCLRHANMSNLWLAGRCISADHDAAASIRVMGTCLASGQAAGAAAALLRDETPCPDWNDLAQRVRDVIGSMVRLPAEPGNWELAG
jgi:hypothetical protein